MAIDEVAKSKIDAKSKMIPFNISLEKTSKDRIIKSVKAPRDTNALWAEPTDIGDGKFILKEFKKGKWEPVDFLEGSGNSSGNSDYAYSKLMGMDESTQSWLGIHDFGECSELGAYAATSCFSKKDITDKRAVFPMGSAGTVPILGRTEKGTLLFNLVGPNFVDLKSMLRVPEYKSSFTEGLSEKAFVIDGESYELEDVTRNSNYTGNLIAVVIFIPAKEAYNLALDNDLQYSATIIVDGQPVSLTVDIDGLAQQFLGIVQMTEAAAATAPEMYADMQKLINDPDIYVPVSAEVINPYWVQGGGGEAEH